MAGETQRTGATCRLSGPVLAQHFFDLAQYRTPPLLYDALQEDAEEMFQTRIHRRGGQGVVTAAKMLSVAAFREERYAQAFPSFGSERTGALIIQDPTLLHQVGVFGGLVPDGYILINTSRSFSELGLDEFGRGFHAEHLCTAPATEFALKHVGRPLPNAALLGGFAALSGRPSARRFNTRALSGPRPSVASPRQA